MQESLGSTGRDHSHVPAYLVEIKTEIAALTVAQRDLEADIDRRLSRIESCILRVGSAAGLAIMALLGWLAVEFVTSLRGL